MNAALAEVGVEAMPDWDSFVRAVHHVNAHRFTSFPREFDELCAFARAIALESDVLEAMLACNPRRSCDALAVLFLLRSRWPEDSRIDGLVAHARLALEFCVEAVAGEQLLSLSYLCALGLEQQPLVWLRNTPVGNPWWLLQHNEREPAAAEFCDSMVAASLSGGISRVGEIDADYVARVWMTLLANALATGALRDALHLASLPREQLGFHQVIPLGPLMLALRKSQQGRWDDVFVRLADQNTAQEQK